MSGIVLLLVGALLCFAGAQSLRLAFAAAGFGVTWLLADAFGASASTALLVALSGALLAVVAAMALSRILFFLLGGAVGAVICAKLLLVFDRGDLSVLLVIAFVPATALICAVLANRLRVPFLIWASAFAGASVMLSGLGRLAPDTLGALHDPDGAVGQILVTVAWIGLAVVGGLTQQRTNAGGTARTPA